MHFDEVMAHAWIFVDLMSMQYGRDVIVRSYDYRSGCKTIGKAKKEIDFQPISAYE